MKNSAFEHIDSFGVDITLWAEDSELLEAIQSRNYSGIRSRLDKADKPFSPDWGCRLCVAAIESNCTCRTVEHILDACPPMEKFSTAVNAFYDRYYEEIEQAAAEADRADVLRLLAERDCSGLPLASRVAAAALSSGSVACTNWLSHRADIDWSATDELREAWGKLGIDHRVDLCLRRVAPHLTGEPFCEHGEIPMPDFLSADIAAKQCNGQLLRRICREKEVTRAAGQKAVRLIMHQGEQLGREELAQLLDHLFTACPELLRCHYPRYALAATMATGGEEVRALLHRHLKSMPGKRIPMFSEDTMKPCIHWNGEGGVLTNWDKALGREYYPALQRSQRLPSSFFMSAKNQAERDRHLEQLLRRAKVMGAPKPGQLSQLMKEILKHASPLLLVRLLEENLLPEGESLQSMLDWCADRELWAVRAAILTRGGKEANYEL